MSNLLQQLKQHLLSADNRISDQEVELWANLYALTRDQQQFAVQAIAGLQQLNSPLMRHAEQILAQDTLLRRAKGVLLKLSDRVKDPAAKRRILDLLDR